MRCRVLLFAQLADAVGCAEMTLEVADDCTVGGALEHLAREHEVIAAMADRIAVAVDEQYQRPEAPLHEGCTIALIPPVSGG